MKLSSTTLLDRIFALKGNFAKGIPPSRRIQAGIEIAPFKDNAEAGVCISSDFEMSWAWRGCGEEVAREKAIAERANVPFILELLDRYSVPITWATVGHLFLDRCDRPASGRAHPDMARPELNERWTGDWYMHDPCSDLARDPLWYAPDLIRMVMECKTPQEIGTHSFSHIVFSKRSATSELIAQEFEACIKAMEPFGVRPKSFVFPENIVEYSWLPLLEAAGLIALRHRDDGIRLSYPERTSSGIYKFYESMNLRATSRYNYAQKAKIFMERAAQSNSVYVLWFHPSDPKALFDTEFRQILSHIDEGRSAGKLWVATMADLAGYCEARERMDLTIRSENGRMQVSLKSTLDTARYGTPELTLIVPMESRPSSAWLERKNGERASLPIRMAQAGNGQRVLVNVPSDGKTLEFVF